MKVVILCGGLGTRLRESRASLPKPLVEIGGKPILHHVMEGYARCGFREFILCLGFGGGPIREYIRGRVHRLHPDWAVDCVETGLHTNTGGRIKRLETRIRGETFFATYADGVADLNIQELLDFHRGHGRVGTLTVVNPVSQFGEVVLNREGIIAKFVEKPKLNRWINGGFFVFNRGFFRYLQENSILEKEPLESLARDRQLRGFRHAGFWCCMDTYKDTLTLNKLCERENPPWVSQE